MRKILLVLLVMFLIGCTGCGEEAPEYIEVECLECNTLYEAQVYYDSEDDENGVTHSWKTYNLKDECGYCALESYCDGIVDIDEVSAVLYNNLPEELAERLLDEMEYIDIDDLH